MRFTDRQGCARLWGLALLCVGPMGACDDEEEPVQSEHEQESSGSSFTSSSRARRQSSQSTTQTTQSTTKRDTVAECKDECDDECTECKVDCDDDEEDCNWRCDNTRYMCRKGCEKEPADAAATTDAGDRATSVRDAGVDAESDLEVIDDTDEEIAVSIQFEARVGQQPFACGEKYTDVGSSGTTVTPTDLRLFVQDVKLINASGDEVAMKLDVRAPWQSKQVALLDFEDGEGQCSEGNTETNSKITGKVPKGTYSAITFSNGVPEKLNHADPTEAEDPLDTYGNLSWGWLGGFRFTKVELCEVTSSGDPGLSVAHIGSTACTGNPEAGTVKCGKPNRNLVELDNFNPKSDVIVFDVASVFADSDLSQVSECHSTGANCEPIFKAFGVDLETGDALSKQSVFSVE